MRNRRPTFLAAAAIAALAAPALSATGAAADTTDPPPAPTPVVSEDFGDGSLGAALVPSGGDGSTLGFADGALVVNDRNADYVGIQTAPGVLQPDTEYTVTASVRLAAGTPDSRARWVGVPGYTWIGDTTVTADAWTTVTGTWTSPATDEEVRLYLGTADLPGSAAYTYLVDDVVVTGPATDPGTGPGDGEADLALTPLKDTVDFPLGVAIDERETVGAASDLLRHHFDQITAENHMKVEAWYDDQGRFQRHPQATALLDYAAAEGLRLYGHVLLWHAQTPDWFFQDDAGRDLTDSEADKQLLRARLATHIDDVARSIAEDYGPFGSETNPLVAWDVVNEVVSDQPTSDGLRTSRWHDILGEEFIHLAFRLADEAFNRDYAAAGSDRPVKLFINDYNTEQDGKGAQYEALVDRMLAAGTPIDGVGHQFHVSVNTPVSALAGALDRFAGRGLLQEVTELDVTVNPATTANLARQGFFYRDAFALFRGYHAAAPASEKLFAVTVWGLTDARSWRAEQAPLLFAGDYAAKPAYFGAVGDDDGLPPLVTTADVFRGDVALDDAIAESPAWRNLPEKPLTGDAGGFQTRWADDHLTVLVRSAARPERIEFTYRGEQVAFGAGGGLAGRTVEADGRFLTAVHLPHATPAVGDTADFDVRVFGEGGLAGSWNPAGATGQLTFVEELSYLEIPRGDEIVVDAVVDAGWADAPRIETATRVEGDAAGATGSVRTLWRDNVLYALFEVVDPEIDTTNSDPWNRDGIELFLDLGNSKSGPYGPNDTQIRITVDGDVTFGSGDLALQQSRLLESATARTSDGYIVEVAIDLVGQSGGQSDVPLGGEGTFHGFDAQVNDARGGSRFAVHTWAEPTGTGYQNTARWGVARLVPAAGEPGQPGEPGEPGEPEPPVDAGAWATVDIGDGRVAQGGSLPVRVSGLEPQQQIGAALYSDPIVVGGIPAADASGQVRFSVDIPRDLAIGEHALVITSPGFDDIRVAVTVVRGDGLSTTGGELPWGAALAAAVLLTAGGLFLALRRRPAA